MTVTKPKRVTPVLSGVRDIVPIARMPITPIPVSIAKGFVFGAWMLAVALHMQKLWETNPADVLRLE